MSDIFMYAEGINGDCTDKHHLGWIKLHKFGFGVGRKITSNSSTKGDRESANAQSYDLEIFKFMDRASPQIFIENCCGRAKQIIIELTKTGAGKGADVYMRYVFHHAMFKNYMVRHKNSKNRRSSEIIDISYTKLEQRYVQYDENNEPLAPIAVGFDTARNLKI